MTTTTRPRKTAAATTDLRLLRIKNKGVYRDPQTGENLRSVTTIINQGMPKEALIFWAGNITAETAVEHLPQLVRASRTPAGRVEVYDWLRRAHTRKKEERGSVGTLVHHLIESRILGTPVPDEIADDPEMRPYMENFDQCVDRFQITFEASEMVVANYTDGYAGTLDYIVQSPVVAQLCELAPSTLFMGDTKTGGELDIKGVYPEAGVQMSAYRRCEKAWLRNGDKVAMPATAEVGVVMHLRPEGFRLIPVACGDAVFAVFQHAQQIAAFNAGLAKTVVGEALPVPPQMRASA